MRSKKDVRSLVKKAYGSIAKEGASCCGAKAAKSAHPVPQAELGLSCGNPVAFSHIKKGDVVLDLGSGAGRDVFLAAPKVGEKGRVIGVDMTQKMIALARKNAKSFYSKTGLKNVEFRKGYIEDLPVEDGAVDLVISNCVINLSPDKPKVFKEIHRVLNKGGRMIVSDIVLNRKLPDEVKKSKNLYVACISGAMQRRDYLKAIRGAGFKTVKVLSDHRYSASSCCDDPITSQFGKSLDGAASSITLMAIK